MTGEIEVDRIRRALADRYRIERVLGEGGMATVYLAQDLKHQRQVAVKVMHPELAAGLGVERFLREIGIAARLSHPHILPVHDSGSADGVLYYVMPLVEGEALSSRLAREKQLPVAEALRLGREVAEALAYAHARGIVHRDIKPANILISAGHALVADFGIARATRDEGRTLTGTGLAIGTPQYMSPEQASGDPEVDGRSDIYALGSVLYEMLTGEPPFTGPTAQAIISRSLSEDPRPITRTRSAVPLEVDRIVLTALAKSPADRYATADEFAAALAQAGHHEHQATLTSPAAGWLAGRKMLLVAAVGVVLLGAAGAALFTRGSPASGAVERNAVHSVAVLPFVHEGTPDEAYFADGIVDELRNRLARLDQLTVIASASADQYRRSDKPPTDIARELRVDQVLMGTVRWASDGAGARKFRVSVELVDGQSGSVSWRDSFDGDMSDPFVVQSQIATRVAGALGTAVAADQRQNLADRPTSNVEAYDLYLQGRAIGFSGPSDTRRSAEQFERAVALDANFAEAWAGLARSLSLLYANTAADSAIARRARVALDRALALKPDLVDAHLAAVLYYMGVEPNSAAAQQQSERALALAPNNAEALTRAALNDLNSGRFERMSERLTRARALNPRSVRVLTSLTQAQIYLGQTAEAVVTADELMDLKPTAIGDIEGAVMAYVANGDLAGARRIVARALEGRSETELIAYFAGYQEMAFVLSDAQREVLFRLSPSSFDRDIAWWGQSLSIAAWQQGDIARARAYADSSLAVASEQITASSGDPQLRILNAGSLAILGRDTEARREAERALSDTGASNPDGIAYVMQQYARVMMTVGDTARALDMLEYLVEQRQFSLQPGWLRVDPSYRALRGNPRFERLANPGLAAPTD